MRKPFKLLIAVPCTDYMHADFVKSLMDLTQHLQREGIAYHAEIVAGTLVYFARDKLACKAINEGFRMVRNKDILTLNDIKHVQEILEQNTAGFRTTPGTQLKPAPEYP